MVAFIFKCTNLLKKIYMIQNFCKNLDKIDGVEVAVTNCGLKKSGKDDLVLIKFSKKSKIIG